MGLTTKDTRFLHKEHKEAVSVNGVLCVSSLVFFVVNI